MNNQTEEKKNVPADVQDDAEKLKQPKSDVSAYGQDIQTEYNQPEAKQQTTPAKLSLDQSIRGKCPPGTTRDPLTGECV